MNIQRFASPEVVISADAACGEGPVFDHRTGHLVWVDILEGSVLENDLSTGAQAVSKFDTLMGAAAPRSNEPGFAVAVSDGLGLVVDGQLTVIDACLPESYRRMNDAKSDSRGRLWAGSNHMEFEPGIGALHRWDGKAPSSVVASGLTLPNGLGWSPDDTVMYLVDSMENALLSAPFDAEDGAVGEFTLLAKVDPGLPDGLTVDADGTIWIAMWSAGRVNRYDPAGQLIGVLEMPVTQPTSCAFGTDGTLYVTSARAGLENPAAQPHAGSVFALPTDLRGVPVAPFAG